MPFPLPEKDDDAEYLLILSFFIVCTLTIILFVILMVAGDFLAGIFHFEFIAPYYWLFCIGFFGISVYQILTLLGSPFKRLCHHYSDQNHSKYQWIGQ